MKKNTCYLLLAGCLLGACRKDFLDQNAVSSNKIPATVADGWLLLNNETDMDKAPVLQIASGDDYYFTGDYWNMLPPLQQRTYIWQSNLLEGEENVYDWSMPYRQVMVCNVVLATLARLPEQAADTSWRNAKATALFKRAFAFFNLAQLFAPPFHPQLANTLPGIPLLLLGDVNEPVVRATQYETYQQILSDLQEAARVCVQSVPDSIRNHANKAAIDALLSRVYLNMHDYAAAGNYADSCLQLWDKLIDYNTVNSKADILFPVRNDENLYNARVPNSQFQSLMPLIGAAYIDTLLLQQYSRQDLRKTIFFTSAERPRRRNFYDGMQATLYAGLAVDEVYLNYAESLARNGNRDAAMEWLNRLLKKRYSTGQLPVLTAVDAGEALTWVLTERRKELVMRGLRWLDLRRLNQEGDSITVTRYLNGTLHALLPRSNLYTLPIPDDALAGTQMVQNSR